MRNMSFSLTTDQIRGRTKTVTRRLGWRFLQSGDQVQACVKSRGFNSLISERGTDMKIMLTGLEFSQLVSGKVISRPGNPDVEIALADIGFAEMRHCISEAEQNVRARQDCSFCGHPRSEHSGGVCPDDNPNDFSLQSPEEYYGGRFPPG